MYVLSKHTNYFPDQRLLNPIIDNPNIITLKYAFVLVYKQEIRQCAHLALKITKMGTNMILFTLSVRL